MAEFKNKKVNVRENKILYLYNFGRTSRINCEEKYPKDFFYYMQNLREDFPNTDFIEMQPKKKLSLLNISFKVLDKVLRKLTKFPIYFFQFATKENFKKIIKSDVLILTNETTAFSNLLFIYILKKLKVKNKSVVFIMGYFTYFEKSIKSNFFQKHFLKLFLTTYDNFIFLGKNEYKFAMEQFKFFSKKFKYHPFSIDMDFWNLETKTPTIEKQILFIGNDKNRDYELLLNIAKLLPNHKFVFVTNFFKNLDGYKNVNLIKGDWRTQVISDNELKKIYANSSLSIIPLKNSLQPSGQSVALQSICMKIPVLISKTKGFWDNEKFQNGENIIFLENDIDSWVKEIISLDEERMFKISKRAYSIVLQYFNLEKNYFIFKEIITEVLEKSNE